MDSKCEVSFGPFYNPYSEAEFRANVRTMGNKFKGKVKYWEGPNEWDQYFSNDSIDTKSKRVVAFMKIMYEELKAIDPTNVIIAGNTIF